MTAPPAQHSARPERGSHIATIALAAVPVLVLTAVLSLFVWPGLRLGPHGVDVAVTGTSADAERYSLVLNGAEPDAFDVVAVRDLDAARRAVQERRVRGALVPGQEPRVLVASADGPAVAQALTGAAQAVFRQGPAASVEDVVPLPKADPRGVAVSSGLLPMIVAGVVLGVALAQRRAAVLTQLAAVACGAAGCGAAAAWLLHAWLGATPGDWWGTAVPVALAVAAVALPVLGLARLVGTAGIAACAVTFVLIGNPLSGATSSPALLPVGWSGVGQLLPPGATAVLLRGASGFDWAGTARPAAVLLAWCAVGVALLLASTRDGRRGARPPARHAGLAPEALPVS